MLIKRRILNDRLIREDLEADWPFVSWHIYERQNTETSEVLTLHVPTEMERCDECHGSGEWSWPDAEDDEVEECENCEGTGRVEAENWLEVMTDQEVKEREREAQYLQRRYGKRRVKSVADYWVRA